MSRKSKKGQTTEFQKNFNEVLKARGLTLKMAAELAEIPLTTVAGWTEGSSPNDLAAVARFCQKLGIDMLWLCSGLKASTDLSKIPLDQLFMEEGTGWDGIFRLKATRLVRKPRGE